MKNKMIIGLAGKARSGKDTVGRYLVLHHNFHRLAFADPLKTAMAATFGVSVEDFHCDKLKDAVEPHWGMTRRAMLQQGADALRSQFGQDLFVRRWLKTLLDLPVAEHVVVTDVRSDAEAETVKSLGGRILVLRRSGAGLIGDDSQHHTERGIRPELVDAYLDNDGNKRQLHESVDHILKRFSDVA